MELTRFVTYRVSQLNARLNAQATRLLRKHCGLSIVQWRILALLKLTAPVRSTELTRGVAMDAGLFSRNLKNLIAEGLVRARVDSEDQRQQILTLTRQGIRCYDKAAPYMKQRRERLLKGLSKAQQAAFFHAIDIIEKNASENDL